MPQNDHTPSPPSMPSSQGSLTPSSQVSSSSSSDFAPRRYKSLADLYENCDFALMAADPTCFEEAKKK